MVNEVASAATSTAELARRRGRDRADGGHLHARQRVRAGGVHEVLAPSRNW